MRKNNSLSYTFIEEDSYIERTFKNFEELKNWCRKDIEDWMSYRLGKIDLSDAGSVGINAEWLNAYVKFLEELNNTSCEVTGERVIINMYYYMDDSQNWKIIKNEAVILTSYADNVVSTEFKEYFGEVEFVVPKTWVEKMIQTLDEPLQLENFLNEYTYDWTDRWLDKAIEDDVLIGEIRVT